MSNWPKTNSKGQISYFTWVAIYKFRPMNIFHWQIESKSQKVKLCRDLGMLVPWLLSYRWGQKWLNNEYIGRILGLPVILWVSDCPNGYLCAICTRGTFLNILKCIYICLISCLVNFKYCQQYIVLCFTDFPLLRCTYGSYGPMWTQVQKGP